MMNRFKQVGLMIIALTLSACGPRYETIYDLTPPSDRAGLMCLNQCLNMRSQCENAVQSNVLHGQQICLDQARISAEIHYTRYRREQKRAGERVELRYADFYRPNCGGGSYNTSTSANNCQSDYRQCYTNCGGRVEPKTVCVANCDQGN